MKKKPTKAALAKLDALPDKAIDVSDIPELGPDFWEKSKFVRRNKVQTAIRYDSDVIDWFKAQGKGYQSRMNAVLRAYVEAHDRKPPTAGGRRGKVKTRKAV